MTEIIKIYGSPGTGKTYFLRNAALKNGSGLYIVFNRSMKAEAESLFPDTIEVRTLHSLCYSLLELKPSNIVTNEMKKQFMLDHGVGINEADLEEQDIEGVYGTSSAGGRLFALMDKARHSKEPMEEPDPRDFDGDIYELAYDWEKFKGDRLDYTDFIAEVAKRKVSRYPEYLYIDEAQDFTPLEWDVINMLISNTGSTAYIAGDDHQKIYSMLGVKDDFYEHPATNEIILDESYRMNRAIWDHAVQLESRMTKIKNRDIKVREGGEVGFMELPEMLDFLKNTQERTFILSRTKYSLMGMYNKNGVLIQPGIRHILINQGIPFRVLNDMHAGLSPWTESFISKYNTFIDYIKKGEMDRTEALKFAISFPAETKTKNIRLKTGVKAKLKAFLGQQGLGDTISISEFNEWFTEPPEPEDILREAFTATQRHTIIQYGMRRPPKFQDIKLFIDTIHASKGMEAINVFIDTAITPRVEDSLESDDYDTVSDEFKVWYVGATRAMERLYYFNSGVTDAEFPAENYI